MAQKRQIVDAGSWSLKVLGLSRAFIGVSLDEAAEHPLEGRLEGKGRDRETQRILKESFGRKLAGDAITVGLPPEKIMHRRLTVPFSQRGKIDGVLLFELEQTLPFSAEEVTADYLVRRQKGGGAELLVSVLPVATLDEQLATLAAARLDPRSLPDPTVAALALEPLLRGEGEDDAFLLVDLGHSKTLAVLVHHGRILAHRNILRGGAHLTRALAEHFGCSLEEAERRKHQARLFPAGDKGEAKGKEHEEAILLREGLEPLAREFQTMLHEADCPVPVSLKLFGGGAKLAGAEEFFRNRLGLRCEILEPSGLHLAVPHGLEDPSWVPGLALGLSASGKGSLQVNLRRLKHGYIGDFRHLQGRLAYLGVLALLMALAFVTPSYIEYQAMSRKAEGLADQLKALSMQVLGEELEDYDDILDALAEAPGPETWSIYPDMTALEAYFELDNIVTGIDGKPGEPVVRPAPPPGAEAETEGAEPGAEGGEGEILTSGPRGLKMNKLLVDMTGRGKNLPGKVEFTGDADSVSTLEFFEGELGRHPCFHSVTRSSQQVLASDSERKGWQRFTVNLSVNCPRSSEKDAKKGAEDKKADDKKGGEKKAPEDAQSLAPEGAQGEEPRKAGRQAPEGVPVPTPELAPEAPLEGGALMPAPGPEAALEEELPQAPEAEEAGVPVPPAKGLIEAVKGNIPRMKSPFSNKRQLEAEGLPKIDIQRTPGMQPGNRRLRGTTPEAPATQR